MSLEIKPDQSVLVLIDHQDGVVRQIKTASEADVRRAVLALAKAANILKLPVVISSSMEDGLTGRIFSELAEALPEAYERRIKRPGLVNAWHQPEFKRAIEKIGRKQVIMAGLTADVCLVFAATSMAEAGYQVHAVMDATGAWSDISEEMARRRMEKAGVVLTAAVSVIAEAIYDFSTPTGAALQELMIKDLVSTIAIPPLSVVKNLVAKALTPDS
ncbi:isochorismatase family protein [Roseomonas hellenica]|uniref:Isochorismatase family protein n=1 Tax=Plastoroseomonas hellenica TaxID=2687306 RepID=A0ABS5EXF6_9PROT|nr:isochorismatase family protein [Plastoroseomonas hellenica]